MYNVVELFSGIGSQAKALKNLGLEFNTVATCEWDVHAIIAYDFIHNATTIPEHVKNMSKEEILDALKKFTFSITGKNALEFKSLKTYSLPILQHLFTAVERNNNFVDICELNGSHLPDNIDILTYSFPCQDLSNVGAFHGYNKGIDKDSGSRSSLLWQVGRLLSEMKACNKSMPRFLLMENVPALLSGRHFKNFSIWISDLKNLGYISKYYQLNTSSFGLPQNRPRLLMISVFVGENRTAAELTLDYLKMKNESGVIQDYVNSPFFSEVHVEDLLRTDYTNADFLQEAVDCTPNETVSRKKIWDDNPQIILPGNHFNSEIDVIRTITTKQDRNPNSGNLYFDSHIKGRSKFRYLTPRECMLFMGFTDKDYQVLKNHNLEFHKGDALFARDKVIRMAGNSIPVKLLEGVFYQIWKIDNLLNDLDRYACNCLSESQRRIDLINRVKANLFARGIRNRKAKCAFPEDADIIYPKYKTAVYIKDCFWHGHSCKNAELPKVNQEFWKDKVQCTIDRDKDIFKHAIDMGWNAIVVWECDLTEAVLDRKLDELFSLIKDNYETNKEVGEIIIL